MSRCIERMCEMDMMNGWKMVVRMNGMKGVCSGYCNVGVEKIEEVEVVEWNEYKDGVLVDSMVLCKEESEWWEGIVFGERNELDKKGGE